LRVSITRAISASSTKGCAGSPTLACSSKNTARIPSRDRDNLLTRLPLSKIEIEIEIEIEAAHAGDERRSLNRHLFRVALGRLMRL